MGGALAWVVLLAGGCGPPEWVPWEELFIDYRDNSVRLVHYEREGIEEAMDMHASWSGREGSWIRSIQVHPNDVDPASLDEPARWNRARGRVELHEDAEAGVPTGVRYGMALAVDDELGLSSQLSLSHDLIYGPDGVRWGLTTPEEIFAWLAAQDVQYPLPRAISEVCGLREWSPELHSVHQLLFPDGPVDEVRIYPDDATWQWEVLVFEEPRSPQLWLPSPEGHLFVAPGALIEVIRWSEGTPSQQVHELAELAEATPADHVWALGDERLFAVSRYDEADWVSVDLVSGEATTGTWETDWRPTSPVAVGGDTGLMAARVYDRYGDDYTLRLIAFDLTTGAWEPVDRDWEVDRILRIDWVEGHFQILTELEDRVWTYTWSPLGGTWQSWEEPPSFDPEADEVIPLGDGRWLRAWTDEMDWGWAVQDTSLRIVYQSAQACDERNQDWYHSGFTHLDGQVWRLEREGLRWHLGTLTP